MDKKDVPAHSIMELSEEEVRYANMTSTKLHDMAGKLHSLFQNGSRTSPDEFAIGLKEILSMKIDVDTYFTNLSEEVSKLA